MLAAASKSCMYSSTRAVIAELLNDLISTLLSSSGLGAGTWLSTHSVSVASHVKSVAVTECKLLRHFDEIPQVTSGSLQGNLTAKKKKKKTWKLTKSGLALARPAGPLLPAMVNMA